jgi:serine/threonine-protein kinase
VLYDVIDALAYAHEQGVVHRDIKPANILRSGSHSLVTDFGVAKALNAAMPTGAMTSTGMAIGTPSYMAPEQLAGDPSADHRIDIYAVGLLAYELLTGKSPFAASTPREVLAAVLTREPQPLSDVRQDVPRRLSEMVMSCLSKDPEKRPPTATALMESLDMFSTSSGEIRTREHRVPVTTPTANPVVAFTDPAMSGSIPAPATASSGAFSQHEISVGESTLPDQVPTSEIAAPKKSSKKILIGGVALVIPVAAAAILLSGRNGEKPVEVPAAPLTAVVTDSVPLQQPVPVAIPASPAAVATVDSQAIRDSARKRAARSDSLKRAAAARADSQRQKTEQGRLLRAARWAASAMLTDANARRAFMRGASRSGGLLGTQRRGDLQTQIDALQPFLSTHGLSYEQFKRIVQESGANIFDEFGRIEPQALQRFAEKVD